MGTWVRVSGKIDLNLYHIYDRLNEYGHPLSSYRYEHFKLVQQQIKKWIERSFHKHLDQGFTCDKHCSVVFDESTAYHSPYDTLEDPINNNRYNISQYDCVTVYINVWDRNGMLEGGKAFVDNVLHTLQSNGCFVNFTTMINVTADYAPEQLIVYTGDKPVELTVKQWGYDGQ